VVQEKAREALLAAKEAQKAKRSIDSIKESHKAFARKHP